MNRRLRVIFAVLLVSGALLLGSMGSADVPARAADRPSADDATATDPITIDPGTAGTLAAIQARGTLVMLCFPHEESSFVRTMVRELGPDGIDRYAGIDIDLMRRFADELGVTLTVRPVRSTFAALIPALLRGEGDLIANALASTDTRRQQVRFSTPYLTSSEAIVTPRWRTVDALASLRGLRASVVSGTIHEEVLLRADIPDLRRHAAVFPLETFTAVADGDADFTIASLRSAKRALASYRALDEALHIALRLPAAVDYGVAVAPRSDLLPYLDRFLTRVQRDGTLKAMMAAHDFEPEE
ncbi:MAG: transporter substrate-binding domain-containing protein [Acidobacteriota bacterium]